MNAENQPQVSEEEKARQQLQAQIQSLAHSEIVALINRYIYVYGLGGVNACWALYSALNATLGRLTPEIQPKLMNLFLQAMQRKVDALEGKPPMQKSEPEPEPEPESEPEE